MLNENHSSREWKYKQRWLSSVVKEAIQRFPVVVITGARQVGKSTFLIHEFKDYKYINLDEFDYLQQSKTDPLSLWAHSDRIIIDEAQRAPELFSYIKTTVDRYKFKKRFILSGSSNLLLMKNITETLAGRAVYLDMYPMTVPEAEGISNPGNFWALLKGRTIKEQQTNPKDHLFYLLKGHMPALLFLEDLRSILMWWEGYIKTYLERDLRELSQIDSLIDFRRLLELLGPRTATIVNQTELARDTGISQPTVSRYLKLLEITNIVVRLPAYFSSRPKRLIKSPKIFFIDPALAVYLSGYHDIESLSKARELGQFFETMIFLHLRVLSELMVPRGRLYYWRTSSGKEVDFVLEHGRDLYAFEVKHTSNPTVRNAKNLIEFLDLYPQTKRAFLLHTGTQIRYLHSKILALPWWWALR